MRNTKTRFPQNRSTVTYGVFAYKWSQNMQIHTTTVVYVIYGEVHNARVHILVYAFICVVFNDYQRILFVNILTVAAQVIIIICHIYYFTHIHTHSHARARISIYIIL
jgi:hypothetical protein